MTYGEAILAAKIFFLVYVGFVVTHSHLNHNQLALDFHIEIQSQLLELHYEIENEMEHQLFEHDFHIDHQLLKHDLEIEHQFYLLLVSSTFLVLTLSSLLQQ